MSGLQQATSLSRVANPRQSGVLFVCFFEVLGTEPRTLRKLSKLSVTKLYYYIIPLTWPNFLKLPGSVTLIQSRIPLLNGSFAVIFSFPCSVVGLYLFGVLLLLCCFVLLRHGDLELTVWQRVALNLVGSYKDTTNPASVLLSEGLTEVQAAFPLGL